LDSCISRGASADKCRFKSAMAIGPTATILPTLLPRGSSRMAVPKMVGGCVCFRRNFLP
jgi:hypothetical protein